MATEESDQPTSDDGTTTADLSFVTTDQLIEELMDRHDGLVIAREVQSDAKGEQTECFYDFSGGVSRAIGLTERLKRHLLRGGWREQDDTEDDED